MGLNHGGKIVTDGLVLMLDAGNLKSFPGEPTTNHIYLNNARIDSTYSSVDLSSYGGTMVQNHPGVIQTYNLNGDAFNAVYYNGGVGDPTNSQHAYWIYDNVIKKPVVQIIDRNGSWQAKSFGVPMNAWSTYGYTVGTQYTISWNQWTTHLSKRLDAGLYTRNSGGTWNFWDGRTEGSASSTNTKTYTWERVYHTFTVTSNWDLTQGSYSIYMYGMSFINNQTLRIADVQLEIKGYPTTFCNQLTRGNTVATGGGWKDLSGNGNHGDLTNMTYNSSGMTFNGTSAYVNLGSGATFNTNIFSFSVFVKGTSPDNNHRGILSRNGDVYLSTNGWSLTTLRNGISAINVYRFLAWGNSNYLDLTSTIGGQSSVFHNIVVTSDGTTITLYVDGVYNNSGTKPAGDIYTSGTNMLMGATKGIVDLWSGNISNVQFYNKCLTSAEVLQNFNSLKYHYSFLGGSSMTAANSAWEIKSAYPTATNGVYWINLPTVGPTQVYCIMDSAYDGGGWMMMMKATRGTTFNYDANYWTTTNTLNPTDLTQNDADAKYDVMNYFPAKDMMARFPDIPNVGGESGSIDGLSNWTWLENNFNNWKNVTPISFFASPTTMERYYPMGYGGLGNFIKDAKTFSGWASGVFSSQTDIRFYGFNYTGYSGVNRVRWGFGWNENGDGLFPSIINGAPGSNDVSGGIGMDSSNRGGYSAGDHIGCCQDTTGINRSARVEVYVR